MFLHIVMMIQCVFCDDYKNAPRSYKIYQLTFEMIQCSGRGYLENVTDSRCAIFNLELVERWFLI